MKFKKINGNYLIRIFKGEKIAESIINFCKENNINSGAFYGIGAASSIELMIYKEDKKEYISKIFNEDLEILSIIGNVAFLDSKHFVHAHLSLSDSKMQAIGGHLKEGVISGTLELVFTDFKTELHRKHDSETGLNLLDI